MTFNMENCRGKNQNFYKEQTHCFSMKYLFYVCRPQIQLKRLLFYEYLFYVCRTQRQLSDSYMRSDFSSNRMANTFFSLEYLFYVYRTQSSFQTQIWAEFCTMMTKAHCSIKYLFYVNGAQRQLSDFSTEMIIAHCSMKYLFYVCVGHKGSFQTHI